MSTRSARTIVAARAAPACALRWVVAQLAEVAFDVAEGDLPAAGVEQIEREHLGRLDRAHAA